MKPARIPLLLLLLVALLCGATGLFSRLPRYRYVDGSCEGFYVQGMWRQQWGQPDEFLYLLAYPEGQQHGGGATEWPLNSVADKGVTCHPYGIYVHQVRADPPNGYGAWVYVPTKPHGDVRFVEVPAQWRCNLPRGDFTTLADSEMWKRYFRPVLVEESLDWSEQFERSSGVYYSPRFPRRSQIDWENLDALFTNPSGSEQPTDKESKPDA
jgi:hypothetical protein